MYAGRAYSYLDNSNVGGKEGIHSTNHHSYTGLETTVKEKWQIYVSEEGELDDAEGAVWREVGGLYGRYSFIFHHTCL